MKKVIVNSISFEKAKELLLKKDFKKKQVFNFFNSNDMFFMKTNRLFREGVNKNKNFNFIDGNMVSRISKGKRLRGPEFTRKFFEDKDLLKNSNHFFIGFEEKDLDSLAKNFKDIERKNLFSYNPPYIKGTFIFPKKEREKIIKLINKKNTDYVWIGVGSPKQTILANQIAKQLKTRYIFTVGAAMDFLLEKKEEAPSWIQKIGLEWLFRLITDFKHTRKKVWQSFIGTFWAIGKVSKKEF